MKIIPIVNANKIKKATPFVENKVKIHLEVEKDKVKISGSEYNEFLVEQMIRAVDFGFQIEDALLLKNEDFVLEFIDIKSHTRRKNLKDVRARVIGSNGKARKTIENLTGSVIVIKDNTVGLIVDNDHLDTTVQAIESLIQGSKHGNVFAYLEKQGTAIRNFDEEDLGLKETVKKK
jgi:ribosomal RNA assembly protein